MVKKRIENLNGRACFSLYLRITYPPTLKLLTFKPVVIFYLLYSHTTINSLSNKPSTLMLHINLDNTQLIISTDLSLTTTVQPHYLLCSDILLPSKCKLKTAPKTPTQQVPLTIRPLSTRKIYCRSSPPDRMRNRASGASSLLKIKSSPGTSSAKYVPNS